jgi:hypothetical protein
MFSIKRFFSSIIGNQYVSEKSGVKKSGPNQDGLYRYTRFELFTDKKDKNGTLARAYRTALVQDRVLYEDAMKNSIAFKFNLDEDKRLLNKNENKNIKITHYTCGDNQKSSTHTGGQIWEFEDGSYIEETITYTRRSYR